MRDPEFHAEWWPQDLWTWEETVNFKEKKAAFPGKGEFTEFLKQCVIRILGKYYFLMTLCLNSVLNVKVLVGNFSRFLIYLGFYGLNQDEHVVPQMDGESLNRKKRNRGHATAPSTTAT